MRALIVDGQNNHAVWPKSTIMMKQYLEETVKFNAVEWVSTANAAGMKYLVITSKHHDGSINPPEAATFRTVGKRLRAEGLIRQLVMRRERSSGRRQVFRSHVVVLDRFSELLASSAT